MYKILEFSSTKVLESMVTDYLRRGWKCQGGVSCSKGRADVLRYRQAMVRNTEEI